MKIFINSRKVDSYKLKITDGHRELFNGLMFSNPKGVVEIERPESGTLVFEWDFNLSREEEKKLKTREDFPSWGINSYDFMKEGPFGTPGFDWIDIEMCPTEVAGLYVL